jgi:SAM-dependent methyltransferase
MFESSKTSRYRPPDFHEKYLTGRVIDIGGGADVVTPNAERFDLDDGDANEILRYRAPASYDCVYSSHCLEHMSDPPAALAQWWALVKPGGHLVVIVPHEDLYEQGNWPSLFNPDHKATFRVNGTESWSPVSFDIGRLMRALPQTEIVSVEVQDHGYDHSLRTHGRSGSKPLRRLTRWLIRRSKGGGSFAPAADRLLRALVARGCPVDQTAAVALAQIQVIARKRRLAA